MMRYCTVLLLLYFPLTKCNILVDILKHKNINNLVTFDCTYNQDNILLRRTMHSNGIKTTNLKFFPNATVKNVPVTFSFAKVALFLNTSCGEWSNLLDTADHVIHFRHPYFWFIFTENANNTLHTLSYYPIEVNSEIIVIQKNKANSFRIYEVYNTGFFNKGKFVVNDIGHWNRSLHLKEHKRMDMSGVVLKCMSVVTGKLINDTLSSYLEISRPDGYDLLHKKKFFTILKYMRDMYGFSYELKRTKSWGYLTNTSFDGMIGALQRGEIDIGGSPVFFRAERFRVMDYSSETWRSKQCFIFLHPKRVGAFYKIFTRPLSNTVWYSTVSLLTLCTIMLGFLIKLKILAERGDEEDSSISIAFLSIWSAVCQQGMAIHRGSTSVKLVIFSTSVFTLTTYQYYNAVVVSTLLREPPKNIRTLEDLLKSDLKTGVEDVLYNIDFFKHATNPVAIQLYNEKVITPKGRNFFTADYGMSRVKEGGFAFHVDSASGYRIMRRTFIESQICQVQEVPLFPPQNMVATVKKNSPYKGILAYGIRKAQESGLMHRLRSQWDVAKPTCVRTPDTSVFSVSIVEFGTPLLLLTFGVVLSVVVLLCEIGYFKWRGKRFALRG